MKCTEPRKQKVRINTLWLSDDWEGLSPLQLKRKLFEKMESSEVAQRRFWEKVSKRKPNECWPWTKSCNEHGYGFYSIKPTRSTQVGFLAHRISYFLTYGDFPEEAHICHYCDNPPCCNPRHLFLGNPMLNNQDKVSKHRQCKGMAHFHHKLTDSQVRKIRRDYAKGNTSLSIIAKEYGMAVATIHALIQRRTWKHL